MKDIILIPQPTPAHKVLVGEVIQNINDPSKFGVIREFKGQNEPIRYYDNRFSLVPPIPRLNDDEHFSSSLNNWTSVDVYEVDDLKDLSVGDWVLSHVHGEYRTILVTRTQIGTIEGKYSRVFQGGSELKTITLNMVNIIGKILRTTKLNSGVSQTLVFTGATGKEIPIFTDDEISGISKTHKRNIINL